MTRDVECLLDAKAALGEGPCWDERGGRLMWVNILESELRFYDPATGAERVVRLPSHVGAAVFAEDGGIVAALRDGFHRVDEATGAVRFLGNPEAGLDGNRFNDGKCDPAGRFWAGTMAYDESLEGRGSLYRLDPDLSTECLVTGVSISNGLAWSSDGRTVYYIDSPTRRVDALDYDPVTGRVSNRRTAIELPEGMGYPDGMTIDAEDNLWVALWAGWGVSRWDPRTGTLLEKVDLPVAQVTSCCFGGEKLDELYITSARKGLEAADLEKQPLAGGLFRIRPGVSGRPAARFRG